MSSEYGLGASIGRMGLVGQGATQERDASAMLGQAADEEQRRNIENARRERERKQQNQTLGATAGALAGAQMGSTLGPYGALIGGVIGGLGASLF